MQKLTFAQAAQERPVRLERQFCTTIAVTVKTIYGQPKVYPANTQAQLLASMNGTKTLTYDALRIAQQMGFSIAQVFPTGELPIHDIRALYA